MPRFNMTATASDSHCVALFDPATLGLLRNVERFEESIEAGRLLAFSSDTDNQTVRFRVFVDEPISVELERRAGLRSAGILHLPGGRLVACDADFLDSRPHLHLREPDSPEINIDPGSYRVEAFPVDWAGDRERVIEEFLRQRSRVGRVAVRFLLPFTSVVALMTLATPVLSLTAISRMRADDGIPGFILPLALVNAAALLAVIMGWRLPAVRRSSAEQLRIEREFPDFVVRFTRTEEVDSTLQGFRCGAGLPDA